MKVPELQEEQGKNIYLSRSEYLSTTTMLSWTTPSPCKKVVHFVRTNDKSWISVWANDHILGRRSCISRHSDDHPVYYIHWMYIRRNLFIDGETKLVEVSLNIVKKKEIKNRK